MQKWRKISSLALMSVALFAFAPSGAQAQSCDPCCDPCDFDGFYVGADFLWWKPNVNDLGYCAVRDGSDFKRKNICPDWEPGVRVFLGKSDVTCGLDFGASYTYINSCDSASTENTDDVVLTFAHPGFTTNVGEYDEGKGSWDSTYHEWDLLFSFDNSCNQCHQLSHFFGVAGIVLDQEFTAKVERSGNEIKTKWDSDFWGVGLRFGTHYTRVICDCFSLFASGHASILAGEADSKIAFDSQDGDTNADHTFKEDEICQIVPGYHLTAGISYDTCVCDWDISLRIGYEFLAWHNVPARRTYVADSAVGSEAEAGIATSYNKTFGFHGLFVGAQMSF